MEFLVLGPLEVHDGDRKIDLGGRRRERCLLGLLLLEVGRVVSVDRLLALLWDDRPPPNARAMVHTHVSRLRARLDPDRGGGSGIRLRRTGEGYVADAPATSVDCHRFRTMVDAARQVRDPDARAAVLRGALALWRGPLLDDVVSDRLRHRVGASLHEVRLAATETCFEAELALGRHHRLVPELLDAVEAHPLRERLVHALMLALHRDGRTPQALETYRRTRARLADTLGIDPGAALRALHGAILRADRALDPPAPVAAPPSPPPVPARPRAARTPVRAAPRRSWTRRGGITPG
jgi:DNA-binding SARP family transcriptional activator